MNLLLLCVVFLNVSLSTNPVPEQDFPRRDLLTAEQFFVLHLINPVLPLYATEAEFLMDFSNRITRCSVEEQFACPGAFLGFGATCWVINMEDFEVGLVGCLSVGLGLVPNCKPCLEKMYSERRSLQAVKETENETLGNVLGHLAKNTELVWSTAEDRIEICFKDCIASLDKPDLVDTEKVCLSNCGLRHIRAMAVMTRVEQKWSSKRTSGLEDIADIAKINTSKKSKSSGGRGRLLPSNPAVTSVGGDFLHQLMRKLEIAMMGICNEKGLQQAHYDSNISGCELQKIENCMTKFIEASTVVDSGVFNSHLEDF